MIVETVIVGALQVNCYILGCEQTRKGAVIDPGDDAPAVLTALRAHGLDLEYILATHAHFDHLLAARPLQKKTGATLLINSGERPLLQVARQTAQAWTGVDPGLPPHVDGELAPGQPVRFGEQELEVRLTPGHSPGGVTLVDHAGRRAFTGDALFAGSIGRTDLPGGNIDTLLDSIRSQILTLPDDYAILPGHGGASTVGHERTTNPFLVSGGSDFWR